MLDSGIRRGCRQQLRSCNVHAAKFSQRIVRRIPHYMYAAGEMRNHVDPFRGSANTPFITQVTFAHFNTGEQRRPLRVANERAHEDFPGSKVAAQMLSNKAGAPRHKHPHRQVGLRSEITSSIASETALHNVVGSNWRSIAARPRWPNASSSVTGIVAMRRSTRTAAATSPCCTGQPFSEVSRIDDTCEGDGPK